MTDVTRIKNGQDVDTEAFARELRTLTYDIEGNAAFVQSVTVEQDVSAEDTESITISVEFLATEDSFFGGGYTIPYE